ncbi:APH(3') family aminoglycoside O-phosphotransferase [Kitasatospora sp. NPDC094015]|uniref:APH(3') family aminoglycoside O-phosphotransferase n=1 Tax=Kitasatospora sp. NPDC094015 TaxID=3155205 RepID=UPI00332733AD
MTDPLRRRFAGYRWTPVTVGCSGATVHRLERGDMTGYLKVAGRPAHPDPGSAHPDPGSDLAAEAERTAWLAAQGIPTAEILDQDTGPDGGWLFTRAVPGRSAADPWPAEQLPALVDALAALARALHALPTANCPYDRTLATTLPAARRAAAAGLVDLDDLDEPRTGWSTDRLLAELDATVPAVEDVVLCHGDLCLPNVLLDPDTLRVTGLIDLGRLGRADRYADLALTARSLAAPVNAHQYAPALADRFLTRYDPPGGVDERRVAFYQLLDEFA